MGYRKFGEYYLDPAARSLVGPNGRISMPVQPMDLLLILTERAGMIVTRDELRELIWHTPGVTDAAIDQAVRRLRRAFGDGRPNGRFIEAVPNLGYRFIAPVLAVGDPLAENGVANESEQVIATHVPPPQTAKRGARFWHVMVGLGLCAIAGLCLWRFSTAGSPSAWRIEGNRLIVLGEDGRKLWDHAFATGLQPDLYEHGRPCQFVDLTNTGRIDTVFWHWLPPAAHSMQSLMCFNPHGKLRWQYAADHAVTGADGQEHLPPYLPDQFRVVKPKTGSPHIVVSSHHHVSFANQVADLDGNGKLISEFWHRGHLTLVEVADLDGDGEPQILLAGVNDAPEYKRASIVIFDHRRISGGSRSPRGLGYFSGVGAGTEKAEIFFPRTPLSVSQEFNRVVELNVFPNRIQAIVGEGILLKEANLVFYELDYGLNVKSVTLNDYAVASLRKLEENGELPKGAHLTEPERLRRGVIVIRR